MIHILMLNWNGKKNLELLQPGIVESAKHLGDVVWHIRDNGSHDGSVELIKSWPEKIYNLIEAGHNRHSFAKCVNDLRRSSGAQPDDYILLLNNDIIIEDPMSISRMIELHKKTGAGIVGCRLLFTGTNKLQHAGVIFSERYNRLPFHYRPGEESDKQAEQDRYFQAVTAACSLVKASLFDSVGGLDEGYLWAFEDIDFCLSVGEKQKIVYCGSTKIYHEESAGLKKNPVNKMFTGNNVKRFRDKWEGRYTIDHDSYLNNPSFNVVK